MVRTTVTAALAAGLFFLCNSTAKSSDFEPLSELDIRSEEDFLYITKRCTGLSIALLGKFGFEKDEQNKVIGNTLWEWNSFFSTIGYNLVRSIYKNSVEKISIQENLFLSDVETISKRYAEIMEENRITTGSFMKGVVDTDAQSCKYFHEILKAQ